MAKPSLRPPSTHLVVSPFSLTMLGFFGTRGTSIKLVAHCVTSCNSLCVQLQEHVRPRMGPNYGRPFEGLVLLLQGRLALLPEAGFRAHREHRECCRLVRYGVPARIQAPHADWSYQVTSVRQTTVPRRWALSVSQRRLPRRAHGITSRR